MTTPDQFTQRVYVVVEAGAPGHEQFMAVMDHEVLPGEYHYRDEQQVAAALRRLADRFEQGGGFVGPVRFDAVDARLARNEP